MLSQINSRDIIYNLYNTIHYLQEYEYYARKINGIKSIIANIMIKSNQTIVRVVNKRWVSRKVSKSFVNQIY